MPIQFTQGIETWSLTLVQGGPTGTFGNFVHSNTQTRQYNFPDKSGMVALLSDIPNATNPEGLQFMAQTVTSGIASPPSWVSASVNIGSAVLFMGGTLTDLAGLGTVEATHFVGDLHGNADTVTTIPNLSGDVNNIDNEVLLNHTGVIPGTYNASASALTPFTVDAKGRITAVGEPVDIAITPSTVEIGTITSGATPGVTNSGTPEQAVLDFVFPLGEGATTEVVTGTTVLSDAFNSVIVNSIFDSTIFLPQGTNNQTYSIKNANTGIATISAFAGDTIEQQSTYVLLPKNAIEIIYFNGNWFIG